jgi:hypothetical protein
MLLHYPDSPLNSIVHQHFSNYQNFLFKRPPFRVGRLKVKGTVSCEFQPLFFFNPSLASTVIIILKYFWICWYSQMCVDSGIVNKKTFKLHALRHSTESAHIGKYLREFGIGILGWYLRTKEWGLFVMPHLA